MNFLRKSFSFVLFQLMVVIFGVSCSVLDNDKTNDGNRQVGCRLPHFTVEMRDGKAVSDSSLLGNTSVIAFFDVNDTYSCDKQLREIQKVYDRFKNDGKVKFLLMAENSSLEDVEACWTRNELAMPYSLQNNLDVYHMFAESGFTKIYVTCYKNIIWFFHDCVFASASQLSEEIEKAGGKCS